MVTTPSGAASQVQVEVGGDASNFNSAMDSATDSLIGFNKKTAAVAAGGLAALGGAMGAKGVSAAADFESAMADVAKVTDEQTANELADDLQSMSEEINLSSRELATLASQAGRFGVEGTENIKEFTRVAGEMGAATQLSSDAAGRALAKLAESTGAGLDSIQSLGDSVNELSNNFATNSQEIVDTAQRSGFALQDLGLKSDEILGLAASMNEVAPTSRRAATMLQQVSGAISDPENVEQFSELLGVSTEQFNAMRDENPQQLIQDVADAMGNNEEAADSLTQSLSNAQSRAFQRLAGRGEDVAGAMDTANTAMQEGGSLSREVAIETDTLSGKFQLLKSKINNVFIEIGEFLLPVVTDLVDGFDRLIDVGGELASGVAEDIAGGMRRIRDGIGDLGDDANLDLDMQSRLGTLRSNLNEFASGLVSLGNGNWQEGWDQLTGAVEDSVEDSRRTLVGESGSGGLVGAVSDATSRSQQHLETEGGEAMQTGLSEMASSALDAGGELTTILIGPDGESGLLTEMVDQGIRFMTETMPELFGDAMNALGRGIRQGLIDITNPLRGEDSAFWSFLSDAATWTFNNLPRLFVSIGEGIVDAIIQGFQGLVQGLVGAEEGEIWNALIDVANTLKNNMSDLVGGVGSAIVDEIKTGVNNTFGDGIDKAGDVWSSMTSFGEGIIDGIISGVESIGSQLGNAVTSPINSAINTINDVLPGSLDIPQIGPFGGGEVDTGAAGKLPNVPKSVDTPQIGPFGGGSANLPGLPLDTAEMAEGGIVQEQGLVEITNPPETVVPSDVQELPTGGMGPTIKIDTIQASSRAEGRAAARGLHMELKSRDL